MNNQVQAPTKEREYLHTLSAGAVLPFVQATLLALVVTFVVWVVCDVTFNMMDPHKPAIFFGALAWLWMLWKLFRHWLALTMPDVVTVIKDISDDGRLNNSVKPEEEEEPIKVVRIQIIKDDGHVSSDINLPGDHDAIATLARGLLNGMPFSEGMWTGKGKPFSSKTFRALRDVMRSNGLAEYINEAEPKQGIRLTEEGKQVMQSFASPTPPPHEKEQ